MTSYNYMPGNLIKLQVQSQKKVTEITSATSMSALGHCLIFHPAQKKKNCQPPEETFFKECYK